ncbi:MAG: class I SAM-dependent methyltransferase [Gramella sp.]|nr:class I SAM-dependent methyltransferase [Christiangramia sp.]
MEKGKDIALEFNEFSRNYTEDMIRCVPCYLELLSGFTEYLAPDFQPTRILDLGCGNGNVTKLLAKKFPEARFDLVDASEQMLELCKNQFGQNNMQYHQTYFKDFQFSIGTYDLIVAGFSLHHCEDEERQTVFNKIYSSLKPGGIFAYTDLMISKTNPDHPQLLTQWRDFVNSNFPDGEKWDWVMEHYAIYDNPTDYKIQLDWLEKAGFHKIQIPFQDGYWIFLQAIK